MPIWFPQPEDVTSLLSIKLALRFAQLRDIESMRAVARAHQNRNLADFEKALKDYREGAWFLLNSIECEVDGHTLYRAVF